MKLFIELPILYKNDEDADFKDISDFTALDPGMTYVNIFKIQSIEEDPFHGDKFCLIRYENDDVFCCPMSGEELANKLNNLNNPRGLK